MEPAAPLPRRRVLQFAGQGGALLALAALTGCRSGGDGPLLLSVRGEMPAAWLKTLPAPWRSRSLESPAALLAALAAHSAGLLALGDGWADQLDRAQLHPLKAPELLAALQPRALEPSRLFQPEGTPSLAYPWAFGTWLLLLRNRADLARRREEGWSLLLDPSLRQKLVLPASPRLVIELAVRQLGGTGADPAALADARLPQQIRRLQRQALALDERDGLNLLLSGEAEAAVVPSHQAIPLLLRDPRLQALLPASGSPLWWQLLLRPAPAAPLPLAWLLQGQQLPMLDRLLAGGWVPPLARERLEPALARWPSRLRPLLLPPDAVLARCNSLVPWSAAERRRWQALWDQALA